MKWDVKKFYADLGIKLEPEDEITEINGNVIEEKNNLVSFVHPESYRMDCPRMATYIHIRNLVDTYGKNVVLEAIDMVVHEDSNEQ